MKTTAWIVLTLCISHAAMAAETILLADFNNKPLNQPIGTGGAVVGEPTMVAAAIDAIVRAAPGGGRMLEMFMEQRPSTQSVIFQFLDDQEVSSGSPVIRARLRLAAEDEFTTIIIRSRIRRPLRSNRSRLPVLSWLHGGVDEADGRLGQAILGDVV